MTLSQNCTQFHCMLHFFEQDKSTHTLFLSLVFIDKNSICHWGDARAHKENNSYHNQNSEKKNFCLIIASERMRCDFQRNVIFFDDLFRFVQNIIALDSLNRLFLVVQRLSIFSSLWHILFLFSNGTKNNTNNRIALNWSAKCQANDTDWGFSTHAHSFCVVFTRRNEREQNSVQLRQRFNRN